MCSRLSEGNVRFLKSSAGGGAGDKRPGQPTEEAEGLLVKTTQKARQPSLFLALCRAFGPYFLVSSFYKIIHDILMFMGPIILRCAHGPPYLVPSDAFAFRTNERRRCYRLVEYRERRKFFFKELGRRSRVCRLQQFAERASFLGVGSLFL